MWKSRSLFRIYSSSWNIVMFTNFHKLWMNYFRSSMKNRNCIFTFLDKLVIIILYKLCFFTIYFWYFAILFFFFIKLFQRSVFQNFWVIYILHIISFRILECFVVFLIIFSLLSSSLAFISNKGFFIIFIYGS